MSLALLSICLGGRAFIMAHAPKPPPPSMVGITVAFDSGGGENSNLGTMVLEAFHEEGAIAPAPGHEPEVVLNYVESGPRGRFDHIVATRKGQFVTNFAYYNMGIMNLPRFMDKTPACSRYLVRTYVAPKCQVAGGYATK